MIISVVSPVHGQAGNSTIALLISILLSQTQNKKVCLSHLSAQSMAFYDYLGLEELADKTCTPSQVVKLMREGAISPKDMADYCISVNEKLDIFSNNSKAFSNEDMELTVRYIIEHMPHDFVILDVDVSLSQPLVHSVLEKSDLVLISLTQSQGVLERYGSILKGIDMLNDKAVFVCNHYSSDVCNLRNFAKIINKKMKDCCYLHHSEMLMKLSNAGRLSGIVTLAKSLPLPELEADLKRMACMVMAHFKLRGIWK